MPKDSPWFRHDGDARNDPKLAALKTRHGMAGLGRWWTLCEILRSQDGYRLPLKSYVGPMLATEWLCSEKEAQKLLDDLLDANGLDLLRSNGKWLWSERMCRQMQRFDEIRAAHSEGGIEGARIRWGKPAAASEDPGSKNGEGQMYETVVDEKEVKRVMKEAGRRCSDQDAHSIAEALGKRGGTMDALHYSLGQIKGLVKSPGRYLLSMIEKHEIVAKWNLAGRPEGQCKYCGGRGGHSSECKRPRKEVPGEARPNPPAPSEGKR